MGENEMTRVMCVAEEFHDFLRQRVIRDRKLCKKLKEKTNEPFFETFEEATRSIVPELKRLFR